jgi:biopolymer transport protein ExbD
MRFKETAEEPPIAHINLVAMVSVLLMLSVVVAMAMCPKEEPFVHFNSPTCPGWDGEELVVTLDVDFDGTVLMDGQSMADQATWESKLKEMKAASSHYYFVVRSNNLVPGSRLYQVLSTLEHIGLKSELSYRRPRYN